MTRQIAAGVFAAAFGLAVSAGAQTPPASPQTPPANPPSAPTSPYPSAQADRAGKDTKLTGCVAAGTAANSFELTNVKKGMGAGGEKGATVKLSGGELAAHVGHTVEVTGSWAKGGDTASAAPAAPAEPGAAKGAKEFNVTAVKMVSSTCTAGTN